MDRNSITGVILIVLIVIGYNALYPPVINVENDKSSTNNKTITIEEEEEEEKSQIQENEIIVSDSSRLNLKYGVFAKSANGSNEDILIENDLLKLSISPKGGRIVSAILKKYQTTDSLPLDLLDRDSSKFNITFFSEGNRIINSEDLFFKSVRLLILSNIFQIIKAVLLSSMNFPDSGSNITPTLSTSL